MNTFRRFLLRIPSSIYGAMIQQARAELPNECCGLLAGHISEDETAAEVTAIYPLINELKSPTEFVSEPRSHLRAERDIRSRALDVLAVYHSHPASEPIPSKRDLERNYSPRVMNLILDTSGPWTLVLGWWLSETRYVGGEFEVIPDPQSEIQNPQ